MRLDFKKGYSIYKSDKNKDLVIVAPHSGPALGIVTSRDDHSDTVASLCWKNMNGTLIISNLSRRRLWGIDFNRDIPSLKDALKNHKLFYESNNYEEMHNYRKKYAWVAKDEKDYENRLNIYQNFWGEVSKGKIILIIHKSFTKMKAVPSIMDITTFYDKEIRKKPLKETVDSLNKKYSNFLTNVSDDYRKAIMSETKRSVLNSIRIYKKFDLNLMSSEAKTNMEKDLEKVKKYADIIALNRLKARFSIYNYLSAVKNALNNIPLPKITLEDVFSASSSYGPKRKIFPIQDRLLIQIECSAFIGFWHPHIAASIIQDFVEKVKDVLK